MPRGEGTKKISDLFSKYKKRLVAPEASVVSAFVEVVEDLFGFKVPKDKVSYTPTTKTLSLTVGSALKTEIKLREEEVLNHLKGRLGEKNAPRVIL